jgi:phosphatidylglycerophosphatase A
MSKLKELLFTGFYSGYFPWAPGTVGSLVGMVIYILEFIFFGDKCRIINVVVFILMVYPSIKLSNAGEIYFGEKDPPQVVIDEVMGYWISVLLHPFSYTTALLAFFIFRLMDIIKPFPVRNLEKLEGGMGILMDDLVAGIYTNVILVLIFVASKYFNIPIY